VCFPCDTGFCEEGMRSIRNGNNAEKESGMVINYCCVVSVQKIAGQMNPNGKSERLTD
jgi:hypothetical protein